MARPLPVLKPKKRKQVKQKVKPQPKLEDRPTASLLHTYLVPAQDAHLMDGVTGKLYTNKNRFYEGNLGNWGPCVAFWVSSTEILVQTNAGGLGYPELKLHCTDYPSMRALSNQYRPTNGYILDAWWRLAASSPITIPTQFRLSIDLKAGKTRPQSHIRPSTAISLLERLGVEPNAGFHVLFFNHLVRLLHPPLPNHD